MTNHPELPTLVIFKCCFDFLIYTSFSTNHKKQELAVELFEKILERKEIHAEEIDDE